MLAMLTRDNDKDNMQCVWDVVKSQAIWLGMVKERAIFSKGLLTGEVSRILHLKKTTRFVNVTKVLDTTKQLIVSGDEMLSVIAKEAAMRHPPTPSPLEANWIHRHVGPTLRQSESSMSLARNIASKVRGEDCGIFSGIDSYVSMVHIIESAKDQSSYTSTMDGFVPALTQQFGLFSLLYLRKLIYMPTKLLPPEVFAAPHIPLFKSPGVDLNKCTRPIVIESGVHRVRQRSRFKRLQIAITPEMFMN